MSNSIYVLPEIADRGGIAGRLGRRLGGLYRALAHKLVRRGLPPAILGSRFRKAVTPGEAASQVSVIHEAAVHRGEPCRGFARQEDLPADPGWWTFSFRDVFRRKLAPTRIATMPDARVLAMRGGPDNAYTPAVLDSAGRSVELREIRYRPFHSVLAGRPPDLQLDEALWIAERVFDNYSHWFTSHLPKLVMLRDKGALADLVLPAERPSWIDESLRRIGIAPGDFHQMPAPGVLGARRLRLVESDRFRPELLTPARRALAGEPGVRDRRVFISRRHAKGRALLEEAELEPLLLARGFEMVAMETLSLGEQIALMARTETLLAPHGAGLTNMLFCPPGALIGEIADPAYPNPNFYAMASALGHRYHYIAGRGVGDRHPLRQDLSVRVDDVRSFLDTLP